MFALTRVVNDQFAASVPHLNFNHCLQHAVVSEVYQLSGPNLGPQAILNMPMEAHHAPLVLCTLLALVALCPVRSKEVGCRKVTYFNRFGGKH